MIGRPAIAFAPIGAVRRADVEALAAPVASALRREAVVADGVPLPLTALHPGRGQYLSTAILRALERVRRPSWERLLGVAEVDLFAFDLNFVFGEADPRGRVAVMSLARMRDADEAVFRRRAETEALHELGHAYGLGHCRDPRCVMWFSNTLAESDRKGTSFCHRHWAELVRVLAGHGGAHTT